ncbi:HsdR family type I site-specific deoxyribonuclease [Caloranaerobacter sp. DY30410]|uniref:type I restriction endonuclease subunit R n=1 Tax=Caloranaerobacter sp. DY30410 TaxID=3238305 RepID=UPI003D082F7A
MISLKQKAEILLKYFREGESQREISRTLGISRKTVRKYIKEFEEKLQKLGSESDENKILLLIEEMVSKPKYDTSKRKKVKLTDEVIEIIDKCLEENEKKKLSGKSKQIMKKIDIHEYIIEKGYDISDGINARAGTLTANEDRFMMWRTIDGEEIAPLSIPQLEVLIKGMFEKKIFLDLIKHFIVFQSDGKETIKILAGYHQYHAVNKAIKSTERAIKENGDRKIGVIWHTQGSGKSLSMVFYTGKLVLNMDNPTIVVITDRNDLDNQLFATFSKSKDLLRQTPKQAESRSHLRELLKVESGGIIFTTIQKFVPEEKGDNVPVLTDRKNVIVIADEAHRSQYGFDANVVENNKKEEASIKYGYAKYMRDALPNASFIGFTGTPIELADKNTPAVFGDYIDIYDMIRAVEDGTTVKIYYESRIAKLDLPEEMKPVIDEEYEEITEYQEYSEREKLKSKWSRLEALVGAEKRIKLIAKDIVEHFEKRQQALFGKAMIVVMSRRIAIDLYKEIAALRPEWHSDDDDKGVIKIVMTGSSSDPEEWQ